MSDKEKSLVELFMGGPEDWQFVQPSWPSEEWWRGVREELDWAKATTKAIEDGKYVPRSTKQPVQ